MPTQSEISMNPLSAKGQILTHDGSSRISVSPGTNGQVLLSSSTSTSGLVWTTFSTSASFGFERISSGTFTTGSSYTISSIPQTYQHLKMFIWGVSPAFYFDDFRLNNSTTNHWKGFLLELGASISTNRYSSASSGLRMYTNWLSGDGFFGHNGSTVLDIFNYSDTNKGKGVTVKTTASGVVGGGGLRAPMVYTAGAYINDTAALTSLSFNQNTHNGSGSGSWMLYGIRRFGE